MENETTINVTIDDEQLKKITDLIDKFYKDLSEFNEETKRAWKRDYLYSRELKMLIQGEKITKIKVGGEIIYNNLIKNYDEAISAKKRLEAADKLSK